jgi:hypothetical protein
MQRVVKITPTFTHAVDIWWAYTWRLLLWGILLNLPVAFAFVFVHGRSNEAFLLLRYFVGSVIYFSVSVVAIRTILRKGFKDYEIWLVARETESERGNP